MILDIQGMLLNNRVVETAIRLLCCVVCKLYRQSTRLEGSTQNPLLLVQFQVAAYSSQIEAGVGKLDFGCVHAETQR